MATPIWAPGVNSPDQPNTARIRDYWLGGTHNTEADQQQAAHFVSASPHLPYLVRAHRAFLRRMVRKLAHLGVHQFLDLGSGLPTAGNVHLAAPDTTVVYTDIDPSVAAMSRDIIAGVNGVTYLCADFCEPTKVLESAEVRETLDLALPVALLVVDVLHFVPDEKEPHKLLHTYMDALAPGSYLGLSHTFRDPLQSAVGFFSSMYTDPVPEFAYRDRNQIVSFFDGLEVLGSGVVPLPLWELDQNEQDLNPEHFPGLGGLGRKRQD
ncbi:SAM-dependent methyltransferase [Lentzea terrae]|uniref:SAM-dependent methyltransferase n=1 Tax=Lentzea terrae TaxID=2200761 RepID=UPI000DD3601F|nr:SAM-dependent methyltransferase [Lentzea terrae]